MDNIAVLVPCYNEENTIAKVVSDFKKSLPKAVIYVYDNNSTDNTATIAQKAGAVVHFEKVQGKGNVVKSMFRDIDAKCYIIVDGDDTYPAENAPEMVKEILQNGNDMVIGDRLSSTYFTENKRKFHDFGNILVRKLINLIFKSNVTDIMTGYRAFSYSFVKTFPVLTKNFEIETEMTIHCLDKSIKIANVVVDYRDRPEDSFSKLNTCEDGIKVIATIFKLFKNYKPVQFFSLLALIILTIGIIFLIPVLSEYAHTGLVPKFPSFIASGVFLITSIQLFSAGLILDSIANKNKIDFERDYKRYYDKVKPL